jgi:hypothetical protein
MNGNQSTENSPLLDEQGAAQPRAFLVQDNPTLDFSPLRAYASWPPEVVFDPGQVTLHPQHALEHARSKLKFMQEDDCLLLNGDPVMIGICLAVAAELIGRVKLLRWDRREKIYLPIALDFDQ